MQLVSRLVAHVVKVVIHQSVSLVANRWKSQIWAVHIISMIVWIVIILWCLSPMMLIVVAAVMVINTSGAVEFAMVSLPRVGLDLIVEHLVLVVLNTTNTTATLRLGH